MPDNPTLRFPPAPPAPPALPCSLSYSVAVLGWVAGLAVMIMFAAITWYTSSLLADCYIFKGERQRSYTAAVEATMGHTHSLIIAWVQYFNLFLTAVACERASEQAAAGDATHARRHFCAGRRLLMAPASRCSTAVPTPLPPTRPLPGMASAACLPPPCRRQHHGGDVPAAGGVPSRR